MKRVCGWSIIGILFGGIMTLVTVKTVWWFPLFAVGLLIVVLGIMLFVEWLLTSK